MTTNVFAIPTLLGQAALAAAITPGGDPITISEMVVGDGNGAAVTPLETQTALVNLRATVPITAATRVGNQTTFDAVFGEHIGPFTIREAGLLDENGQLLFVASVQETEKLTPTENTSDILTLGLVVVVSETAQVVLLPPPESQLSLMQMLRAPFIATDAAVQAPPPGPAIGATVRVLAGGTGAFVGHDHELAQWTGAAWIFKSVPITHLITQANSGQAFQRTIAGWVEVFLPRFDITRARLFYYGCF